MPFNPNLDPLADLIQSPQGIAVAAPSEPSLAELQRSAVGNSSACPRCGCEMCVPTVNGFACRHCGSEVQTWT